MGGREVTVYVGCGGCRKRRTSDGSESELRERGSGWQRKFDAVFPVGSLPYS